MRAFRGGDAIKPRSDGRLRGARSNREVLLGERNRVAQMNRLVRACARHTRHRRYRSVAVNSWACSPRGSAWTMETTNALKANGTTREGKTRRKSEQHRPDKWAYGEMSGARGTQRTGGRAMSCARTPSMQGGRRTTASHQSRSHSVTVPRDGATPRSPVPSKIWRASRSLRFRRSPRDGSTPSRCAAAAQLCVELPPRSGYPAPGSSTKWEPAGRVSGYVPKSPGATSLNPGLGGAKSLQNRIVCPRRSSLRRSTWPRLRRGARNLERARENGVVMRDLAGLPAATIPREAGT